MRALPHVMQISWCHRQPKIGYARVHGDSTWLIVSGVNRCLPLIHCHILQRCPQLAHNCQLPALEDLRHCDHGPYGNSQCREVHLTMLAQEALCKVDVAHGLACARDEDPAGMTEVYIQGHINLEGTSKLQAKITIRTCRCKSKASRGLFRRSVMQCRTVRTLQEGSRCRTWPGARRRRKEGRRPGPC